MLRLRIYARYGAMSPYYFEYCRGECQELSKCQKKWREKSETWHIAWSKFGKEFPDRLVDSDSPEYYSLAQFYGREEKHRTSAIMFSVMCLESFIYDYAAEHFSDTYVKKYLDKLDLKAKWVVISKLVTGKDFPTDSQAFQGLLKLIEQRNKLVHYKSQRAPSDDEFEKLMKQLEAIAEELTEKHITESKDSSFFPYETVVAVLTELKRLENDMGNEPWWQLEEVTEQKQ